MFNVTTNHLGKYECKFQTHTSAIDRVFNVKVDGKNIILLFFFNLII